MFTCEIWLSFKCPLRCLSKGGAVLSTGHQFPPQLLVTSQLTLLRDEGRTLLVNIKTGLKPTAWTVKLWGLLWGSENDDTCLLYTRAERMGKLRPKTPLSLSLHNSIGQTLKLSASYDSIRCVEKIFWVFPWRKKKPPWWEKIEYRCLEGFFRD